MLVRGRLRILYILRGLVLLARLGSIAVRGSVSWFSYRFLFLVRCCLVSSGNWMNLRKRIRFFVVISGLFSLLDTLDKWCLFGVVSCLCMRSIYTQRDAFFRMNL